MHYVTVQKFCEQTGIQKSKVYELLGAGDLRAIKVGRRTLIDVAHAMDWMSQRPAAVITTRPSTGWQKAAAITAAADAAVIAAAA